MEDRIGLLDQIRNKEINYDETIKLVLDIIPEVYHHLNEYYLKSNYCVLAKNLGDAISLIVKRKNNGLNEFLNFYELIDAMIYVCKFNGYYMDREIDQIEQILSFNLEKTGWYNDFDFETQSSTLRRKDLKAEVVASTKNNDIRSKIYSYLAIRDGAISDKRNLLKCLIDDVEAFCIKNSHIKEIKKLKQFYQCVRHTKEKPIIQFPFYYEDEEKWLDNIFQMVLDVLSFEDLEKRYKTIISEENKHNDQ